MIFAELAHLLDVVMTGDFNHWFENNVRLEYVSVFFTSVGIEVRALN